MGFDSGSVSFSRFAVLGDQPKTVDQELLDRLAEHVLQDEQVGQPEEISWGFSGGRHVMDNQFTFGHNVFADSLHFALRIDTNKVPSEMKKAYALMEEDAVAAGNPSGFISKAQKKQVRETISGKIDEELRSGKFRRSKLSPILWDFSNRVVYSPASAATQEKLLEIFERTLGLSLLPLSAGSIALRLLEPRGRRRDYEDLRPTRFVLGPDGDSQYPDYPWIAKGPEPKDFLGNEFLLWLWHEADHNDGLIGGKEGATIFIDKSLELDCAYGVSGKDALRGDGPSRMPEARDALRTGKAPRRAGLVIDAQRQQFSGTFNAERFSFSGATLPEVPDADTPRVLFEERIALLRDLLRRRRRHVRCVSQGPVQQRVGGNGHRHPPMDHAKQQARGRRRGGVAAINFAAFSHRFSCRHESACHIIKIDLARCSRNRQKTPFSAL